MRINTLIALFLWTISLVPASANDNNRIDLLQSSTGLIGNTLTIDQSDASNSLVTGDFLSITPARQIGNANTASLTITGDGGTIAFGQGASFAPASGNNAEVTVSGFNGYGEVQQLGDNNTATLEVQSDSALFPSAGIIQQLLGSGNSAFLSVDGTNVRGTLIQTGSNNTNSLEVSGENSSVVFTQVGNNLANATGNGVSVFTNAGNVSITQTNFGTFR